MQKLHALGNGLSNVIKKFARKEFSSRVTHSPSHHLIAPLCVKSFVMAYFGTNFRPYSQPDNSRPLNALGLKTRITYGNKLGKNRDITPRTMGFVNRWKERCVAMLNANPFARKKLAKEVQVLDEEMQSRWDKIHGTDGLCFALVEIFNAMAELRMKAEYGDYLAYTCSALKGGVMEQMIWRIENLDWQAVAERITNEESARAEQDRRQLPIAPTPYLDDVARAATILGYEFDLVEYQILAYADRNNFRHSGLKAMIHQGAFQDLAERIVQDKRSLEVVFRGRPHAQIEMRKVIRIVEKEWFDAVWTEETRRGHPVRFVPTARALEKMRKMASRS